MTMTLKNSVQILESKLYNFYTRIQTKSLEDIFQILHPTLISSSLFFNISEIYIYTSCAEHVGEKPSNTFKVFFLQKKGAKVTKVKWVYTSTKLGEKASYQEARKCIWVTRILQNSQKEDFQILYFCTVKSNRVFLYWSFKTPVFLSFPHRKDLIRRMEEVYEHEMMKCVKQFISWYHVPDNRARVHLVLSRPNP
ncbi:unnamed protein product [Cuscuta epithymum]|uniref:Uncharacterized protein n=1 Tax=Cuscuta epithymum TaxID=186058 RepID=A0AAV0EP73_9ASTE|nr:unnamed protein product [Cuscuta epithymum]